MSIQHFSSFETHDDAQRVENLRRLEKLLPNQRTYNPDEQEVLRRFQAGELQNDQFGWLQSRLFFGRN